MWVPSVVCVSSGCKCKSRRITDYGDCVNMSNSLAVLVCGTADGERYGNTLKDEELYAKLPGFILLLRSASISLVNQLETILNV